MRSTKQDRKEALENFAEDCIVGALFLSPLVVVVLLELARKGW